MDTSFVASAAVWLIACCLPPYTQTESRAQDAEGT